MKMDTLLLWGEGWGKGIIFWISEADLKESSQRVEKYNQRGNLQFILPCKRNKDEIQVKAYISLVPGAGLEPAWRMPSRDFRPKTAPK